MLSALKGAWFRRAAVRRLGFSSHSRIYSYGDVTFADEGLQILTYARHSRPLRSEESLACHTYCDTGHPFIMVRGPVTLTPIAERLAVELSLLVFTTWVCRGWDLNNQPFAWKANALTHCATAAVRPSYEIVKLNGSRIVVDQLLNVSRFAAKFARFQRQQDSPKALTTISRNLILTPWLYLSIKC